MIAQSRLLINSAFSPTGGLGYHLAAKLYGNSYWRPFRCQIANWIKPRLTAAHRLIMLGPSGGYCLPQDIATHYPDILCIDPDPIARIFFMKRMRAGRNSHIRWLHDDIFGSHFFDRLNKLSYGRPKDTQIIFCNLLGQLPAEWIRKQGWSEDQVHNFFSDFEHELQSYNWISFHDRLSGEGVPLKANHVSSPRKLTMGELVATFQVPEGTTCQDHLTENLGRMDAPHDYFVWQMNRREFQIVEAIHHVAPGNSN